jgi:hypothetical protein
MSNFSNSQIYYINSTSRLSGSNSNFSYSIPIPSGSSFDRVTLLQCNIPTSFYIVPASSNTFQLSETSSGVNSLVTITVPPGNYNVTSFQNVLTALLNTASPNQFVYSINFPNSFNSGNTGLFTYSFTSGLGTDSFSFILTTGIYEQLGFNANTTVSSVSKTLTSCNVVKFIPEDSLYIHSDIVNDGRTDVLQEIFYNNAVPFSNATYQCQDVAGYSKPLRTNQSNIYTFSITDENGMLMNLNGLNCVFSLILFKRDSTSDLLKMMLTHTLSQD